MGIEEEEVQVYVIRNIFNIVIVENFSNLKKEMLIQV
jgi:hypothetical protein